MSTKAIAYVHSCLTPDLLSSAARSYGAVHPPALPPFTGSRTWTVVVPLASILPVALECTRMALGFVAAHALRRAHASHRVADWIVQAAFVRHDIISIDVSLGPMRMEDAVGLAWLYDEWEKRFPLGTSRAAMAQAARDAHPSALGWISHSAPVYEEVGGMLSMTEHWTRPTVAL